MDDLDRNIVNQLQGGFPLSHWPYRDAAAQLGTTQDELLVRIAAMLDDGRLSRFGPLYNVEKMGGSFNLCAMEVPSERFDAVTEQVNALPQVAHNYERDHRFNMWFVLAAESADEIAASVDKIERVTGLKVFQFPKLEEFFVGLRFDV